MSHLELHNFNRLWWTSNTLNKLSKKKVVHFIISDVSSFTMEKVLIPICKSHVLQFDRIQFVRNKQSIDFEYQPIRASRAEEMK